MENVNMQLDGDILTITVDMAHKGPRSGSGKSMVIASTKGNVKVFDTGALIGLTIYRRLG